VSESPDEKNKDSKSNSDLSDLVQWSNDSNSNLPLPPPPEPIMENPLDIPPPPPLENLEIPPPPPPVTETIPPPPGLEKIETPDLEIPPPPALESSEIDLLDTLPPPPLPEPNSLPFSIPEELSESLEEVIEVTEVEDSDYRELWKRTSDKPLQQVYGHIDRLGTGEIGSLLDRYADRFGSELDREIIVLRQQERQQKIQELQQVPIVELIEEDDEVSPEITDEDLSDEVADKLEDELDVIEDEINELQELYEAAKKKKKKADIKKYGDSLTELFERKDEINAILDGDEDYDSSDETEIAKTLEEDLFDKFVGVVDDLLGKLPEDNLNSFLTSSDFDLYKTVASEPNSASNEERKSFFKLVNDKLAKLPEDVIEEFIASENWSLYEEVGELYN